jgi:proteic killer suppression protein
MINSFKCSETQKIWNGDISRKIPNQIQLIARRKLRMIAASSNVETLKIPPANHLKKLKGKKNNQYSIRINNQWRICFHFFEGNAYEVEIIDYH